MIWLAACAAPTPPPPVVFVRDGIVRAGGDEGRGLPDGRRLVDRAWSPGDRVDGSVAPIQAECVRLFSVPLGDAGQALANGGDSPDTALAFSPDGRWLAIGTWRGEVLVVDGWTGAIRARRTLAETLVRQVAWSPDGTVVYAAEQSPDAAVHALDPATLATRATARLADDVGTSPAPSDADPYGVYTLPAAYALVVLGGGDLVVSAAHGWNVGDQRKNASRVLRLHLGDAGFQRVAAWPADGPADAVFGALAVAGDQVAVAIRRSASGDPPADLPIGGVQRLSADLHPLGAEIVPPLKPYYDATFVWDALAIAGDRLVVGLGDGRLRVGDHTEALGTPVLAGDVPIAASIGFVRLEGDQLFAITSRTAIPYGAASPDLRPPRAHPDENTLWAFTIAADGRPERDWAWRGPHVLGGLAVTDRELAVGAGPRDDDRTDLFGALLFAVHGEGQPRAFCATDGPAYPRPALAPDGRVAIAEVPWRKGAEVVGGYRATVLR